MYLMVSLIIISLNIKFLLICKRQVDTIIDALAHVCRELLGLSNDQIPLLLCHTRDYLIARDAILYQSIDETSIKVITSSDCADSLRLRNRILLTQSMQ